MKTLYFNAAVYAGDSEFYQSFIEEDGYFTFVGTNEEGKRQEHDASIDLGGRFVCAGFNDSHMHLLNFGQTLSIAPLYRHTGSLEDMIRCLKNTSPGPGGWILGRGWNQDYFADTNRMPDRWDLDRVSRDYPVCATRACGHALAVNSRALELLRISRETPQVNGGRIELENGEPNGIFLDNAMELVTARIPAPTIEDLKKMILLGARALNAQGITSCQSDDYCVFQNVPWQQINQAFQELEAQGKLTVRVYEQANFTSVSALEEFIQAGNLTGTGSDSFRIGPLKLLGDGALGARTAYLSRPYADAPQTRGLRVFSKQQFDELIGCAHTHGMQVAVHCIGDACLDLVLDSLENALDKQPRADHRHGIVHCQITRPDQLERIAKLNLHVYAQSIFLDYDIHMVRERVGEELANTSYHWKTLADLGVCVSNGSDCPVEMPHVLAGIQCAVTRRDRSGFGPYLESQAFTLAQALDSFTKSGARASFEEHRKGRILPGMLADFVVLDQNPFSVPPAELQNIRVLRTCVGGNTVYAQI